VEEAGQHVQVKAKVYLLPARNHAHQQVEQSRRFQPESTDEYRLRSCQARNQPRKPKLEKWSAEPGQKGTLGR